MDFQEASRLAKNRSKVYWFLAEFYRKRPERDFLDQLKEKLKYVKGFEAPIRIVLKGLEETEDILPLQVEFTRLFRGIKKGYGPPPPYESVYRGEGRVMGRSTMDVIKLYREVGVEKVDGAVGPQDHISAELRFMAFLTMKEKDAWENRNVDELKRILELEERFLTKHLLPFASDLARRIKREAKLKFYIGITGLTRDFVKEDLKNVRFLRNSLSKSE